MKERGAAFAPVNVEVMSKKCTGSVVPVIVSFARSGAVFKWMRRINEVYYCNERHKEGNKRESVPQFLYHREVECGESFVSPASLGKLIMIIESSYSCICKQHGLWSLQLTVPGAITTLV